MSHPDVPVGGEDCSVVRKMVILHPHPKALFSLIWVCSYGFIFHSTCTLKVGSPQVFGFPIKDHLQLGKDLDLIDFDAAAEVFLLFWQSCNNFRFYLWRLESCCELCTKWISISVWVGKYAIRSEWHLRFPGWILTRLSAFGEVRQKGNSINLSTSTNKVFSPENQTSWSAWLIIYPFTKNRAYCWVADKLCSLETCQK